MKKQKIPILVLITCIFAAFVFGFFAGRNLNRTPVQIRTISPIRETTIVSTEESTTAPTTEPAVESATTEMESAASDEAPSGNSGGNGPSFPINVNTANAAQLEALPGIGPTIAQRIVDYRQANGPFSSPGQLINVNGIGEKRLAAIWDYITIGD